LLQSPLPLLPDLPHVDDAVPVPTTPDLPDLPPDLPPEAMQVHPSMSMLKLKLKLGLTQPPDLPQLDPSGFMPPPDLLPITPTETPPDLPPDLPLTDMLLPQMSFTLGVQLTSTDF